MWPESVYQVGQKELERFPATWVNLNVTRANTAAAAVGSTFFPGDQVRFLFITACCLTINLQANGAAETRLTRTRIEMLDLASGASIGSLFDLNTRDVIGEGLVPDASGLKLALPLGSALGSYTFNPALNGAIVPPGVTLRHQSFTGGGVPVAHGLVTNLQGWLCPTGTIVR
jgi:hypothetical protein